MKNGLFFPDNTRDTRYTVRREYTGDPGRYWVARFCGDWIGSAETQAEAWTLAHAHREDQSA